MNHKSQHAFTIVEMLIVILIMVSLMAMGVGAWLSVGETNKSLAAQNLVYSVIQQARNRSLSSGEPVVIRIEEEDGRILGMHKSYSWFKKNAWSGGSVPLPPESSYSSLFIEEDDGFALSCTVNAPPAGSVNTRIIPLLLLTNQGASNGSWIDASNSDLIAGIELWQVPQFIRDDTVTVKVAETWSVVAWVGRRPAYPSNRNNIGSWANFMEADNFVREWSYQNENDTALTNLDSARYALKPYTGDRWINIEFMFDNNNLYLFRNGEEIDFLEGFDGSLFSASAGTVADIYVGSHQAGASQTDVLSIAQIKNATLLQVGSGSEEYLPGGILPKQDYKIVANSGIVTCYAQDLESTATPKPIIVTDTLTFVDNEMNIDNFEMNIGPDGAVIDGHIFTSEEITSDP